MSWSSPTFGSPDYDHACGTSSNVQVPSNLWGTQAARTGSAYVQVITYVGSSSGANFREYVEAPLSAALAAGQTYDVSFWISRGEGTRFASKEIGAYFSVGSVGPVSNFAPLPYTPQVQNTGGIITNSTQWTQISGSFVAAGGETHIVIGNFKGNSTTTASQVSTTGHNNAGYYIDDVEVKLRPTGGAGGIVQSDHLIGFADLPSPTATGFIDIQDVDNNCQAATTQCKTSFPVRAPVAYAGGTAYDPRYQTVWVSEGWTLSEFYAQNNPLCKQRCKTRKASFANPQAYVSGLACADKKARLFQLATLPGYMEIAVYDNRQTTQRCPTKPVFCKRKLKPKSIATGLAYDEIRDLLYINIATAVSGGGFSNLLWVSKASNPCQIICEKAYYHCGKGMVTGLAYSTCGQRLYATDGQITQPYVMLDPLHCKFKTGKCCKKQITPFWRGLAVIPGWKAVSSGSSCTQAPCPTCPSMKMFTSGDPSLGSTFGIGLQDAPSGAFAALYLKVATAGTGIPLPPPFCGTWFAFPSVFSYPVATLPGPAPCGGKTLQSLPIPVNPNFCGIKVTSQYFVFCVSGSSFGLGLSNALTWTIASS